MIRLDNGDLIEADNTKVVKDILPMSELTIETTPFDTPIDAEILAPIKERIRAIEEPYLEYTGSNIHKYGKDLATGNFLGFKDRTYFGAEDKLPKNLLKDTIESSNKLGVNPWDAVVTLALESRFDPDLMSEETTLARISPSAVREASPVKSFEDFVLSKGYTDKDYVIKDKTGMYLDYDNYIRNTKEKDLNNYISKYEDYLSKQKIPEQMPLRNFVSYLSKKGVQGYNPQEKKGNAAYKGHPSEYTYSKDRMERFNEISDILKNEKEFMGMYNTYMDSLKTPNINKNILSKQDGGLISLDIEEGFADGGQKCGCNSLIKLDTEQIFEDGGQKNIVTRSGDFLIEDLTSTRDLASNIKQSAMNDEGEVQCTAGVCQASTVFMNKFNTLSGLSIPNLTEIREKYGWSSGKNHPNYDKYGESLDAWDIQGALRESGGIDLYTAKSYDDFSKLTEEQQKEIMYNFPIGTVINYGNEGYHPQQEEMGKGYNVQKGLLAGNHSAVVVGYTRKGEGENTYLVPIVWDYNRFSEISNYSHGNIINATVPKEHAFLTKEYLKDNGYLDKSFETNPLKIDVTDLQGKLYDVDNQERGLKYNQERTSKFISSLENNKNDYLQKLSGISSNEEYDELAKIAVAIAMAETKGGNAKNPEDVLKIGDSRGMTQINLVMAFDKDEDGKYKDPQLVKALQSVGVSKSNNLSNPEKAAAATMAFLSVAKRRADINYNKGKDSGERVFSRQDSNKLLGLENTLKSIKGNNPNSVVIEEKNVRVNIPKNRKEADELINKLEQLKVQDRYRVEEREGEYVIIKKTEGNRTEKNGGSDLSLAEKISYNWNSPNALVSGDAQGNSNYVKKVLDYLNLIQ